MSDFNVTKLEYQFVQALNALIHQQPPITLHQRLYFIASNHADAVLNEKVGDVLDGQDQRREFFPDALRYAEISFVSPPLDGKNEVDILISIINKNYKDVLSNGFNAIGASIMPLKSTKVLAVILVAYFKPNIPEKLFRERFTSVQPAPSTDTTYLVNLLNNFRNMLNLPNLNHSDAIPATAQLQSACKIIINACFATQVFQACVSDIHFYDIISDLWNGFTIRSIQKGPSEFEIIMTFSRQTEAVDVHVTTLLINRQGQSPKIDTDKVLRSLSGTPAAPQSAGARGRGGRGGAGRKGQPSNARRSVQTDVKGERLAARQEKNVKAVDTWNSPQKQQPAPQPFKGKRAAPWAEVTPLLAAQKPQPQPQSKRQNPPRQQQQNVQPQQTPQPQNQPQSVPHPTAEGWAGVTQAALLAEQQQAPKQEQEQKIVSEETDFQPVVKTLHQPTKAAAWQVFDPHEVYDDKNAYRRLPADLKRSHIQKGAEKPPKQQQQQNEQQQQKRPQKQNSRQKGKKQQKQQPQHEQEQEQNVMQEQEENATVWGEIQKALNSAQPFDDRNQVRKLAPELRRSHVKAVTQEKPKNQKKEKQPRGNQKDKKNPKEKANNNQNKPVQNEQPIGVEQEKVVEETITPVNPVWASVAEDAPYDDSRDVRRLPPQLRRSHAPPKVAEEQKPEPKQKKNKNVEKNDKPKDRKKGGKNQNKEDKKLEALKPIVSSAWANLVIPEPKPKPEPQQQATSEQPKPEQTHEEPIVTIPKPTPELIAQPEPEVVQPQVEDEEQEQPHEAVPLSQPLPKDSPWLNLTVEKLTAPRQKPAPKPKLIPQPEPIKDVESPVQIEEELESMPEPAAPVEIEEEEVHEVEEVKSLAPPPAVVSVWATVKNEKAYDDKNDWRKTPADLRRTHVKQVSADDQQKDKQQQQQRRPKKENNNKKGKGKQNKQIPTQQPQSEPKEPEHVVENPVEEIPESQPAAPIKTIWATINTNTPYDDSRDMRKLPPELRRTHKKAAEPTSEEKRGKKGKKADRQNGKQPNQKPQPNQQQPVEEEVVEEEQVQPIEEPEQQQQQQQPKSPWALINTNAPYDDRRDVSRLPPELRRTHKQPQPAKQEEKGGNNNERQGRQQKQTGEQENQSGFAFKKLKRAEQPPPK